MLEGLIDPPFDLLSFFMEVPDSPEVFHPRPFLRRDSQFFLDRLRDQLAQRNPALGGDRFGATKQEIGNFQGRFHVSHITIFMGELEMFEAGIRHHEGQPTLANDKPGGTSPPSIIYMLRPNLEVAGTRI
ncbi:MAG TPA: hypothetical protein VMU61_13220 [Candidatus Aquilonibacter sp.]|nr:hypothetical protein [Candidatus Aquilonibacter sp.]